MKRLPDRRAFLLVYGGVVFIIYSWALRGFFFQLSSFLLYHSVGEIIAIFAYMMALALLESLAVMAVLMVTAALLPEAWLRRGFVYKAFLATLVASAGAIALETYLTRQTGSPGLLYAGLALSLLAWAGLIQFFDRLPRPRSLLLDLIERLQIFAYIYVPLGLLSLLIVLIRNLG
ncbi:MAG: hypothetical protein ACM3QS_01665 [Bacteroidota bacterium]